jgi:8-oxo-dGTP pyrophosphatase MutT (NUDIX family)
MKQAAVNLIIQDGLILGITRRHDKTKYGLPGGAYSEELGDKNPMDTAKRECQEETSIIIKECQFVYKRVEIGDNKKVNMEAYTYYATDWSGEPQDSEEGEVAWLSADELTNTKAAFGNYNRNMLNEFGKKFPYIFLMGLPFASQDTKDFVRFLVEEVGCCGECWSSYHEEYCCLLPAGHPPQLADHNGTRLDDVMEVWSVAKKYFTGD